MTLQRHRDAVDGKIPLPTSIHDIRSLIHAAYDRNITPEIPLRLYLSNLAIGQRRIALRT